MLFKLILLILLSALSAHGQTAEDLFNSQLLHEIRIDVHPNDWFALRQSFLLNTYYAADVHWLFGGRRITAEQAGIRSRGLGSRNGIKPGLLVNFERYNEDFRFLGLRSFVLRNNAQDASMLREHLGMSFMQRMGIAAPRTAYTRLFVNGDYWGVYTIVESIDEDFLQRNFGNQNGYLYSYEFPLESPYFFEYRGAAPAFYTPLPFQPETHEDTPNPAPLVAMISAMNHAGDAEFFAAMSQYLNLTDLARYLAAEAFIAEEDGIVGNWGLNNFHIYRLDGSNLFRFIPWDKSQVLINPDRSVWTNLQTNVLTRRSFTIPEVRSAFVNAVLEGADSAGGAGGWLEQEITRAYMQIRTAVLEDPMKQCYGPNQSLSPCSNEQFEAAVRSMLQFARERRLFVRRELLGNP